MIKAIKENIFFLIILLFAILVVLLNSYCPKEEINKSNKISISIQNNANFNYNSHQLKKVDSIFCTLHKRNVFNGCVLIGQKDSIFYKRSFGFANKTKKNKLHEKSIFQLSSVSKQFTAVAILQLYEKGLLDLNDSIQKFIPNFPYKGVTIHLLLTHRSGLPNYHYFMQHIPTYYDTIISNKQLVNEIINKQPEIYYTPNRRYHYSNTGYAILASVVENVANCSFTEYIHKNIFEPLNMTNSYTFLSANRTKDTNITTGYLTRRKQSEDNYLDGVLGDKGVYCSTLDMFKWEQGLYKNIIISDTTLNLAFQPMGKPKYFNNNYGYGWRMFYTNDSIKVLYHAGWWHGYKSLVLRIPKDTASIIIFKNESNGIMVSSKTILEILYPLNNNKADTNFYSLNRYCTKPKNVNGV